MLAKFDTGMDDEDEDEEDAPLMRPLRTEFWSSLLYIAGLLLQTVTAGNVIFIWLLTITETDGLNERYFMT